MPRNKVEWVKITGRVSEELTCPEDVELVRTELETRDQGDLLRDMVRVYRLYKEGKLMDMDLVKIHIEATIRNSLSLINENQKQSFGPEKREPVAREDKPENLPQEVKENIETQVKGSSLLSDLQKRLQNGGVGPKS